MSKDTKPMTLDREVEKRFDEAFLCSEESAIPTGKWLVPHKATKENIKAFLASEIKAAEEKTLYFDNFEKIVEDIGQNWTAEQMDELINRITDWRDAELAAMQDSL